MTSLVAYASLSKNDITLEVGAGLGFFTEVLSKNCKHVIAVEKDARLFKVAKEKLGHCKNVTLIHGDIFQVSIPYFNKLVSTPPYKISSPLLFWILERPLHCAVLTFQKEFAERLTARVGSKKYSRISVATYIRARTEILEYVSPDVFYPSPEVDSAVVRLKPLKTSPFKVKNSKFFEELLRAIFTQRNKKVKNAVSLFLRSRGASSEEVLEVCLKIPFRDRRVRELAPEEIGVLADELA